MDGHSLKGERSGVVSRSVPRWICVSSCHGDLKLTSFLLDKQATKPAYFLILLGIRLFLFIALKLRFLRQTVILTIFFFFPVLTVTSLLANSLWQGNARGCEFEKLTVKVLNKLNQSFFIASS